MSRKRAFRSSFYVLWRWTTIFCSLLGALVYGATWLDGNPLSFPPTMLLAVGLGLVFALAVVAFPVYVLDEGVRCYNFYGVYGTIRWDDAIHIRRTNLFGLRYAVVSAPETSVELWLPLYLSDMNGFIAAIQEHVSDDHPLVMELER
jgi:hypothetical protein